MDDELYQEIQDWLFKSQNPDDIVEPNISDAERNYFANLYG